MGVSGKSQESVYLPREPAIREAHVEQMDVSPRMCERSVVRWRYDCYWVEPARQAAKWATPVTAEWRAVADERTVVAHSCR